MSGRFLLQNFGTGIDTKNNYNDTKHNNFFCGGGVDGIQQFDLVVLKAGDSMKKFFAVAALILGGVAALAFPAAQEAGTFSDWKCSQCGKARHMAG